MDVISQGPFHVRSLVRQPRAGAWMLTVACHALFEIALGESLPSSKPLPPAEGEADEQALVEPWGAVAGMTSFAPACAGMRPGVGAVAAIGAPAFGSAAFGPSPAATTRQRRGRRGGGERGVPERRGRGSAAERLTRAARAAGVVARSVAAACAAGRRRRASGEGGGVAASEAWPRPAPGEGRRASSAAQIAGGLPGELSLRGLYVHELRLHLDDEHALVRVAVGHDDVGLEGYDRAYHERRADGTLPRRVRRSAALPADGRAVRCAVAELVVELRGSGGAWTP